MQVADCYELADYGDVGMLRWLSEFDLAPGSTRKRLTGQKALALDCLQSITIGQGENVPASLDLPNGLRGVSQELWRENFYSKLDTQMTSDAKRKAFQRAMTDLQNLNLIGVHNDLVWPV